MRTHWQASVYWIFVVFTAVFFLPDAHAFDPVESDSPHDPHEYVSDESEKKQSKEDEIVLPDYPAGKDLQVFTLSSMDTVKRYLDTASLSVGNDGVVRYTLVVEMASGSRNVFYEGIRCNTREYKTYAVGTLDKSFSRLKRPQWRRIMLYEKNINRGALYRHFFCDDFNNARPLIDIDHTVRFQEDGQYRDE
jgi:hypothetical protein